MATFEVPSKAIITPAQLEQFQQSATHTRVLGYIETINDAVVGVKLRDTCDESEAVRAILGILDDVAEIAKQTPPIDNSGSRFGNPAFRTFYDRVGEACARDPSLSQKWRDLTDQVLQAADKLHRKIPGFPVEALAEVTVYFRESWGDRTRVDYGSGMELNFLCWLICLDHLGVLTERDHVAIVTRVFWRYIQVMRILQSTYWLEPAGSHGVWGLDDYHFLPFLFGSAQLKGHKFLRPKSIHDNEIVEEYSKDYMYLACIQFINSIKTATLRWHSPMLDDISAVKTWDKINLGMIKMYLAEVLGKLPVVQHFLFGSILPFTGDRLQPSDQPDPNDPHFGHTHPHGLIGSSGQAATGWGDCCGIPVPSAFGAAAAAGKTLQGPSIRPVPFD